MLNIIICQNSSQYMNKIVGIINQFLGNYDMDYRIHKFYKSSDLLYGIIDNKCLKKIYIIDYNVEKSSWLDISLKIRESDWNSIIIFTTTSNNKSYDDIFYHRLMALDFISINQECEKRLAEGIRLALKILYRDKTFVFKYNYMLYQIPYNTICYIEKEPLLKRCIIHTLNDEYYVVDSIGKLAIKLGPGFYRTHQSCIVNIGNIRMIDLCTNTIIFRNGISTNLLSDRKKKEIKDSIGIYLNIKE